MNPGLEGKKGILLWSFVKVADYWSPVENSAFMEFHESGNNYFPCYFGDMYTALFEPRARKEFDQQDVLEGFEKYRDYGVIMTMMAHSHTVREFCAALNCENIDTMKLSAAPRNPARCKKSPKYYFEYHSLIIKPFESKSAGQSKGGTHASPITHLRRGHFRTLRSGARIRINSMVVNEGQGFCLKDYDMRGKDEIQ